MGLECGGGELEVYQQRGMDMACPHPFPVASRARNKTIDFWHNYS